MIFAAFTVPAEARDDLMPPPKSAPRIPVEVHELSNAALAALKDSTKELEGKGQAIDGERLMIGGREIRLFGIVTPALTSSFGPQTRSSLDRMLSGNNVLCKITDRDTEGHPLAFCGTVKVPDLSYEMLLQGWAMVDRRALKGNTLSEVYDKAEQEAQSANRGIFAPAPMAMAVPVSDPTKTTQVPAPEQAIAPAAPVAAAPAAPAPEKTAEAAPKAEDSAANDNAPRGSFVERYQILLGACLLLVAATIFTFAVFWKEQKNLTDKRRALAAALRGELMSARLICRTRAKELLRQKKTEIEPNPTRPSQLWPRIRSFVYQAHVSQLGLLGAELARQVASVYGQFADYAAYYQSSSTRTPIPRVVGETLDTLSEHVETLLQGLAEVESTGRALMGEDIMAEEEARAAADNVRLAVAAASKRALPAPRGTTSKLRRSLRDEIEESEAEEDNEEEEPAAQASKNQEEEEKEESREKPARATQAA